jgi:hypothetical protein
MGDNAVGLAVVGMMGLGFLASTVVSLAIFHTYVKRMVQPDPPPVRRARRAGQLTGPDFSFLEKTTPVIDTFHAGAFICDECGRRSYFDLITLDDLLLWPKVVDCQHCLTRFRVMDPRGQERAPHAGE